MLRHLKGENVFCYLLFFLGITIVIMSLHIGFGELRSPGGGLFPFICGLIICINCLWISFAKKSDKAQTAIIQPKRIKKFAIITSSFFLWIITMPFLGWLSVTFLITLTIAKMLDMEGWIKPLSLSVCNTFVLYMLFGYWLQIDLPKGFWVLLL